MRDCDTVFANLENNITTKGRQLHYFGLRANPSLVSELERLNVGVVTFANNHTLDWSYEGMFETMDVLRSAKIVCVGTGRTREEAFNLKFLTLGKSKVGFVGFTTCLPEFYRATALRPGAASIHVKSRYDIDFRRTDMFPGLLPRVITELDEMEVRSLLDLVDEAKENADFLIAGVHWGVAAQDQIIAYQIELAHKLIDHGVDVVAGHHPHILHGIEVYKGKPIFYSLSHLTFHLSSEEIEEVIRVHPNSQFLPPKLLRRYITQGAIVKMVTDGRGGESFEIIPIALDEKGDPHLCHGEASGEVLNHLMEMSERFSTRLKQSGDTGRLVV